MNPALLAAGIFLLTYALIISERTHRTVAALLGGLAVIVFGIIPQREALIAVDWNVIFLLTGMMVIANILRATGVFQWVAVQAVKLGRGEPFAILLLLVLITAYSSALLDNVTVVVLIAPVTLFVATSLGVSPIPFLVAEVMASNIGGVATLIGDPPQHLDRQRGRPRLSHLFRQLAAYHCIDPGCLLWPFFHPLQARPAQHRPVIAGRQRFRRQ